MDGDISPHPQVNNLNWLIKEKPFNKKDIIRILDDLIRKIQEVKTNVEHS